MSLNVQRSRQGETYALVFRTKRRSTQFTHPMVARPALWLVGLFVLLFELAENRADVPAPEPNPTAASGRTTPSTEEEPTPYKKLSLEELMKIEVSTVSRTES